MRVDTDEMIVYGKARNGDGMVCAAIHHLFEKVGTLPANYWGRLPSSADWRKGWDSGVKDRAADATSASDVLLDTSVGVLRAMANYTNTDIEASVNLENVDPEVKPYLRSDIRDDMAYDAGRYGADGTGGFDPRYRVGDNPDSPFPVDSPPGNSLAAEAQYRDEYAKLMAKYASLFRSVEEAIEESLGEVPEVYEPFWEQAQVVAGLASFDLTVLQGDNCAEALRAAYQKFRTDIRTALDDAGQSGSCKLGSEERDRPRKPELRVDDWKHPREW